MKHKMYFSVLSVFVEFAFFIASGNFGCQSFYETHNYSTEVAVNLLLLEKDFVISGSSN